VVSISEVLLRKVQLVGGSTLAISLPKNWTRRVGLKPGDYVFIALESDGSLRITPKSRERPKKPETVLTIKREFSKGAVVREIMSRYLAGYKVIAVRFEGEAYRYRRYLKDVVYKKLIGVEFLDENVNEIVLQVLVNVEELPANTILRRMGRIASGMLIDAVESLDSAVPEKLVDIVERDDEVDKLYLYVLRQLNAVSRGYLKLNEVGLMGIEETLQYGVVAKSIERIADHAQRIAQCILEMCEQKMVIEPSMSDTIKDFGKAVRELFRDAVKSFVNRDRVEAHSIIDSAYQKLTKYEREIIDAMVASRTNAYANMLLRLIVDSIKRVMDYSIDISEATLDLTVKD